MWQNPELTCGFNRCKIAFHSIRWDVQSCLENRRWIFPEHWISMIKACKQQGWSSLQPTQIWSMGSHPEGGVSSQALISFLSFWPSSHSELLCLCQTHSEPGHSRTFLYWEPPTVHTCGTWPGSPPWKANALRIGAGEGSWDMLSPAFYTWSWIN